MMIPRVRAALCSARQPFDCRVEVPPGGECGAVSVVVVVIAAVVVVVGKV